MSSPATRTPDGTAGAASRRAFRQTLWFTVAGALTYVGVRNLPMDRGALHYDDFHAGGKGFLEFCEPGGPQFVPVDRVRSPVTMTLRTSGPALRYGPVELVVQLTAASGKAVTIDDLLVVHTRKLHLLVIDPSLDDYQHLHPVATDVPGEFSCTFTPRRNGLYRVFGDFTPRATGRALYAGASLDVGEGDGRVVEPAQPPPAGDLAGRDLSFELVTSANPVRINETSELTLRVRSADGSPAPLQEIMGARAHVVAFDAGRTGFAHLHPLGDPAATAGDLGPLKFQLNLADPGAYRLWAQVRVDGQERFAPFDLVVQP